MVRKLENTFLAFFVILSLALIPSLAWSAALDDFQNGLAAAKSGDNAKAVELFTKAIDSGQVPKDNVPVVYLARGIAKSQLKKFEEALKDFNKAIELNPKFGEAYLNRASMHLITRQVPKAVQDFDKGLELLPDVFVAYNDRGLCHELLGEYAKARADYEKALQLRPDFGPANYNLAKLLATCKDPKIRDGKRALQLANQAVEMKIHTDYELYSLLAAAQAETGDFTNAIASLRKAIKALPPEGERVKKAFEDLIKQFENKKVPWHAS